MQLINRWVPAIRAALIHFVICMVIALLAAVLVFGLWYPYPYSAMSGGRELFLLVMAVDVICGPLLTLVLYDPSKQRRELVIDIGLIVLIQLSALCYGLWTVWHARPLYLVNEVDRFKVIAAPDIYLEDMMQLPENLRVNFASGPLVVGIRAPINEEERKKVMFDAIKGGRDYAERPEFYVPYVGDTALKSLVKSKPISVFLARYPKQTQNVQNIATGAKLDLAELHYVPVIARQDWIALIGPQGQLAGFVKGDGF
jgi:hypothetical protein